MKWNNTITGFNTEGKIIIRADNVQVCVCDRKEDADYIVTFHNNSNLNETERCNKIIELNKRIKELQSNKL